MPTITVPDETYARIARRAEALGTTVEALVAPALEQMVAEPYVRRIKGDADRFDGEPEFVQFMAEFEKPREPAPLPRAGK